MGMTTTEPGNIGRAAMMTGTVTIKKAKNPYESMLMRKAERKAKKPLNYNHREISAQLMRAKRAQNAAGVVTSAKRRLAVLQRQAGSGQYDKKEIEYALAHARRMVRCAQLKVRNLREEEQERRARERENGTKKQELQNEIKRRTAQKERELKSKLTIEQLQRVAEQKRKKKALVQKEQMHRSQEQSRIQEADMRYIKGMMERNGEISSGASCNGAVFDLSMEAAAMQELALLEQAQQIETEAAAEAAAEITAAESVADSGMGSSEAALGSVSAGGAETAPAVNISI